MQLRLVTRESQPGPVVFDQACIDGCRRGDPQALERVFKAHAPVLERTLARLLRSGADVEDALQQTFVAAIRGFPRFRAEASIGTWLTRIAVHQALELMRRPHHRRGIALELVGEPVDEGAVPDRQGDARRKLERIREHLDALSANKRMAFVLHVIEGRPMVEVAALMDASVPATKSRVMWARRGLLARLRRDPLLADLAKEASS
jgi:RNA polymerase sigma-70 factor (ECF subfamily)